MILDELVKPNQPVINYRTSITGLDAFALRESNAIPPLADIQVADFSNIDNCLFFFFFFLGVSSSSSVFLGKICWDYFIRKL